MLEQNSHRSSRRSKKRKLQVLLKCFLLVMVVVARWRVRHGSEHGHFLQGRDFRLNNLPNNNISQRLSGAKDDFPKAALV